VSQQWAGGFFTDSFHYRTAKKLISKVWRFDGLSFAPKSLVTQ
jgi:hypothetical protein